MDHVLRISGDYAIRIYRDYYIGSNGDSTIRNNGDYTVRLYRDYYIGINGDYSVRIYRLYRD